MKPWSSTADFILRSVVTAAVTLYITWAVVHSAMNHVSPPDWLMLAAATDWAFYFGNHFVQNGKMLDASKIINQMQSETKQVQTNTAAINELENPK
jgi:hypothetical protein